MNLLTPKTCLMWYHLFLKIAYRRVPQGHHFISARVVHDDGLAGPYCSVSCGRGDSYLSEVMVLHQTNLHHLWTDGFEEPFCRYLWEEVSLHQKKSWVQEDDTCCSDITVSSLLKGSLQKGSAKSSPLGFKNLFDIIPPPPEISLQKESSYTEDFFWCDTTSPQR